MLGLRGKGTLERYVQLRASLCGAIVLQVLFRFALRPRIELGISLKLGEQTSASDRDAW